MSYYDGLRLSRGDAARWLSKSLGAARDSLQERPSYIIGKRGQEMAPQSDN